MSDRPVSNLHEIVNANSIKHLFVCSCCFSLQQKPELRQVQICVAHVHTCCFFMCAMCLLCLPCCNPTLCCCLHYLGLSVINIYNKLISIWKQQHWPPILASTHTNNRGSQIWLVPRLLVTWRLNPNTKQCKLIQWLEISRKAGGTVVRSTVWLSIA